MLQYAVTVALNHKKNLKNHKEHEKLSFLLVNITEREKLPIRKK